MKNLNIEQENDYFKVISLEQRSPEWKAFRRGKIGASDMGSVMGLNPFESKLACWERIAFGKEKETNPNMERGIRLEPEALRLYNELYAGKGPYFKPIVMQSKKHEKLLCSLDGWDGISLIELKAPRKFSGKVPEYYYPQLQSQLFISNTSRAAYAEYVNGEIQRYIVERDEKFINRMIKEALDFLQSIVDFRPPAAEDRDWLEEEDAAKIVKSFRYKELSLLIDELETERDDLRREFIADAKHPRIKCGDISIQKILRKGVIDYSKIIEEYEITDSELYRKSPTEIWRIS